MNPKLVALHGPLKGTVLELLEEQFSIGRDRSNRLRIHDKSVSRSHAVVRQASGRIEIVDLDSQNGTFVNGVPIRERVLEAGDQIRIGQSLFALVADDEDPVSLSGAVQLDEGRLITRSEVRLSEEDSSYLNHTVVAAAVTERVAKDLKALLAICTGINAVRKPDALQYKLLESIFEVIPADAGAVLLLSEGSSDEFASTIGWSRRSRTNDVVQVGRSVVQKVAKDRTALMSNDVCAEGPSGNESRALRHVQSVLAAPVRSVG